MGMNVDADIFFGFVFGEGFPNFDLYEAIEEWNQQWAPKRPEDRSDMKSPEWEEWREKNRAWEKTGPGLISGFGGHSEGGHKDWVGLMGHRISAYWYPEPIPVGALGTPSDEEVKALTDFLKKYMVGEFKLDWYLSPSYG